jgi:uncharacterized protein
MKNLSVDVYLQTYQKRAQERKKFLQKRQAKGYKLACQAAHLLKTEFGADTVFLFGSMLSLDRIHERSDIDLAVTGLNPKDYFRALGKLQGLDRDFPIDLVEVSEAKSHILAEIYDKGMIL